MTYIIYENDTLYEVLWRQPGFDTFDFVASCRTREMAEKVRLALSVTSSPLPLTVPAFFDGDEYKIYGPDWSEAGAHFTNDLEDARYTARYMWSFASVTFIVINVERHPSCLDSPADADHPALEL